MNKQFKLNASDRLTALGLLVAACGILIEIASGVATVTIPVGAIILLTLATLIFLRLSPWITIAGMVLAALILLGAFIAPGLVKRLSTPSEIGPFIGTVLQLLGLVIAIIAGGFATRSRLRDPRWQAGTPTD